MSGHAADAGTLRYQTPSIPAGRVQRKVPAPYGRPVISVGGPAGGVPRAWRNVPARAIQAGDVIPGLGLVHAVHQTVVAPPHGSGLDADSIVELISWTVTVRAGEGRSATFPGTETVWCFTVAK